MGVFSEQLLRAWPSCARMYLVDIWGQQANYKDAANVADAEQVRRCCVRSVGFVSACAAHVLGLFKDQGGCVCLTRFNSRLLHLAGGVLSAGAEAAGALEGQGAHLPAGLYCFLVAGIVTRCLLAVGCC